MIVDRNPPPKAPTGVSHALAPISIATSAPTAAPPETPMTYGSARGLRKSTCSKAPASASEPPVAKPESARGRRNPCTMARDVASPSPSSACSTVAGPSETLPTPNAMANAPSATTPSAPSAVAAGMRVIAGYARRSRRTKNACGDYSPRV